MKLGTMHINATFIVMLLLIFFIGLRGFIITDFVYYYRFFYYLDIKNVNEILSLGLYEPGFLLYTYICKSLVDNYYVWIFISSLIDIFLLYFAFKRYSYNLILSFIVYMSFMGLLFEFNLMRNSKAILIFLISLKYIERKEFIKYFLCNIIAITFHFSAVFYIPLYFILGKTINKKIVWIIFLVLNILVLAKVPITSQIFNFAGLDSLLSFEKWQNYLDRTDSEGLSFGFFERVLSFIIFTLSVDRLCEVNSFNRIFYNCYLFYYFTFLICSDNPVFMQRIPMLFIFSYWIMYPNIISIINKRYKSLFIQLLLILCFMKLVVGTKDPLYEYENIIFGITSYEKKAAFVSSPF